MASEGMTNKAIAERLSVSVRTVEGHIYRACMKLDVPRPHHAGRSRRLDKNEYRTTQDILAIAEHAVILRP